MLNRIRYLNMREFDKVLNHYEGNHWTQEYKLARWSYHAHTISILKRLKLKKSSEVLEIGTMGAQIVRDSHTLDFPTHSDWEITKHNTFHHDARNIPWPVNKKYKVIVALRVFQHLTPKQQEVFEYALDLSQFLIICTDENYNNPGIPHSKGISRKEFVDWSKGKSPLLEIVTGKGKLFLFSKTVKSCPF